MSGEFDFVFDAKREDENHKEYVYRVIRENIMTLRLLPGSALNEAELAQKLDVSRTPVHEAIAKLRDERLVVIYPRKASIVSKISVADFKEGYFLRKTIEPAVIEQIEGKCSDRDAAELLANIHKQERLVEEGRSREEFLKIDDEFHELVYKCAAKEITWRMVKSVNGNYDRVRYMDAIMNLLDVRDFFKEHRIYYEIIKHGELSLNELQHMVDGHLGRIWRNFDMLLKQYPDYFKNQS